MDSVGTINAHLIICHENHCCPFDPSPPHRAVRRGLPSMPDQHSRWGGGSFDDGPAANTALGWPFDAAVDSSGNLFIADAGNHRIRKVATDGTISTVAGT